MNVTFTRVREEKVKLQLLEQPKLARISAIQPVCLAKTLAKKGYRLAELSLSTNGIGAMKVDFIIG